MTPQEMGWAAYTCGLPFDASYARVAQGTREHFLLWTERGECEAALSGRLRHELAHNPSGEWPCVGDWVKLREGSVIIEVLPRRTKFSRKEPGSGIGEQVLVSCEYQRAVRGKRTRP